jgi:hypothetical protein
MAMDARITLKEKFIDAPGKLELAQLHIKEEKEPFSGFLPRR